MSDEPPPRRMAETGWTLGASGLPKPFWAGTAVLLAGIGVVLLFSGYIGYGVLMLVVAGSAAVNLL